MAAVPEGRLEADRRHRQVLWWIVAAVVVVVAGVVVGSSSSSLYQRWFTYSLTWSAAGALVLGGVCTLATARGRPVQGPLVVTLLGFAWATAASIIGLYLLSTVVRSWTAADIISIFITGFLLMLGGFVAWLAMMMRRLIPARESFVFLVSSAFLVLAALTYVTNIPTQARFAMSQDALDRHAAVIYEERAELPEQARYQEIQIDERIGEFDITRRGVGDCAYADDGSVVDGVYFDWDGGLFIWCLGSRPDEPTIHDGIRRLGGDWYVMYAVDP